MTTAELLRAARALIAVPERWTQRATARDRAGAWCGAGDPRAARWCPDGALRNRVYRGKKSWPLGLRRDRARAYVAALRALEAAIGVPVLQHWNDAPGRTHAQVVAAFSMAIALAEREEAP